MALQLGEMLKELMKYLWGNVEGANEISEEKYNKINISVLSDCVNANMVSNVVRSTDWKGKSTSQKRSLLENAYNSFSYDKYNFDQESNGIHIYSDRTSMSTQVGDNITIGVDVYENNKPTSDCSGVSLSIENSSVYTLKNTEIKNNRRYFILKSKSAGNTRITISDSKTEYIKRFYLYSFNNDTCSYTIRNIPRYKIGNYTCNLNQGNSVFVDDFNVVSYNDSTGIANISLTVYNSLGVYGAVEIYDKDAKLQDVAIIKKFKSASTSIKECLWDKTLCLVDDVANDNLFSYHSSVSYKETKITATIPKDGYIRITTDAEGSVPVSLINMFDMLMAGKSIAGELSGFDSKEDIFAEKLSYNMVVNKIYEKLLQSDSKFASKLVKKVGKDVLYSTNATGDYLNSVLNNLQDVDMMKTVKETAWEMGWSIGEDIFEYFSGPIGLMMKGLFTFSKIGNLAVQINDFIRYQGTEYASVSNPASGAMYSSEVIVISDNEEKNTAIRSYRIEIKDELFPELIEMLERRNQKVYRGDKSFFYEIKYIKDGVLSEPDSSVEVNIPIPEGMVPLIATKKVKLYRINDDNSIEEMTYTYKNGYLSFKTDHFSYYSIVTEKTSSGIVGDADYDSIVTVMDASLIQYYLANMAEEYDLDLICSDVNNDKEVGIVDATYIQRYIAGIINGFSLPESVSLNYSSKQMNVGDSFTLKGSIIPSQVMYNDLTWESSNKSVATVNNGVVTAKAAGTATITATTHNGKTAKCSITVISKPTSISLNKTEVTLHVDESVQLSATLKPSRITDTISWSSQYNSFASVSNNGYVYANHVGDTTITARTSNGLTATCNVHIIPRTPSVVLLDKENLSLDKGDGYQLHASVSPSDADQTITWSSSDTSIATVNPSGYITTIKSGQVNITAKASNGVSKTCKVEVYQPISGYMALVLFTKNEPNGCARITKDFTVNLLINDTDTTAFCGIINGDFHTITYSYEYKTKDIAGDCYRALIPKTDGALIKNITVSGNVDHDFYPTASNKSYCAGIVAYAKNTTFENCSNQAKIDSAIMGNNSGYAYAGGITAWGENCVFKDCKNSGNIPTVSMPSNVSISISGGIVGVINGGSIERCISTGGIGTHATNSSSIYYTIAYSGGIVGQSYSATINSCSSSGNVNANSWPDQETQYKSVAATGGIVGAGTANILNSASTCILRPSGIRGSENYSNELIGYEFS